MKNLIQLLSRSSLLPKWLLVSLAFWVSHILLRVLLLFRENPYGFPFVSKPDWYIFHAVCIDFIWICHSLVVFLAILVLSKLVGKKLARLRGAKRFSFESLWLALYAVFHSVILLFTLLDDEVQRFLGSHLSFGIINTYKDTSSLKMFWDYVANDGSVPFLQFLVLALILPETYAVYRLGTKLFRKGKKRTGIPKVPIAMCAFYVLAFLFVHVIWTGNARMTKLKPIVSLVYDELFSGKRSAGISESEILPYRDFYRNLWQEVEGDSLWEFPKDSPARLPLYRAPRKALLESESLLSQRKKRPNFIVVFLESHRGLNVGYLNPDKPSPTPFLDSVASGGRAFMRMFSSGLPTTGGILSTHTGIPHHSRLSEATDLAHVNLPSFASVLKDSGYVAHYFSAADPAWDNLGVWMAKWYHAEHYDRTREDDSTFFDHAISYVRDTLARQGSPFLATLATRSNHYPFNFAAGMPEEEKQKPLTERINYTMRYADRQLARFIHAIEKEAWFENTYLVILADHGFPLGENGVSTMSGGGFSNATWIPLVISGKGIEPMRDTVTTAQIDIAPTILELAGLAVPNIFMGHNLLRGTGTGLSLGAYFHTAAVGLDGYRLISPYPIQAGESRWLFAERDTHQNENLSKENPETEKHLTGILDSLVKISDYTLERGM